MVLNSFAYVIVRALEQDFMRSAAGLDLYISFLIVNDIRVVTGQDFWNLMNNILKFEGWKLSNNNCEWHTYMN